MREYMTDEEINNLVDEIMKIPVEKNNNCLSTYGSVNVDDLINTIKELKKFPTYEELLRENKQLKKQLKYITSGEYYNQLRFERNMLQDLMYNEIPKEYKEFVDYTHRNTELLGEKQELIDYLKEKIKERNNDIKLIGKDVYASKYAYKEILSKIEKGDK